MIFSFLNKAFIIVTILCCSFKNIWAQEIKRGNNWVTGFAPVVKFQFTPTFLIHTFANPYFTKCSSTISDTLGEYQFYSTGYTMMDRLGDIMLNGEYTNCPKGNLLADYYGGSSLFSQTSIILPKKGNQYYVFGTGMSDSVANNYLNHIKTEFDVLNYSIVDMDSNGGLGKVTVKNTIILDNQHYANCALSAVKHGNGKDWWLVKADCENYRFQIFQVTEDSILGPYYQYSSDTSVYCHFEGQLYFSDDGTKMVSSVFGGKYYDSSFCSQFPNNTKYTVPSGITYIPNRVDIYDFDRCNGILQYKNNYVVEYDTLNYPSFDNKSGICFSPNGKLVYMCNIYTVFQIDLDDTNKSNGIFIHGPDTLLTNFPTYGTMACGQDSKLYIGNWSGTRHYMSYIDSPNVKGFGCHFVPQGLWQPYTNLLSPPNMPYFGLGIDSSNIGCWPAGINEIRDEKNFQFSMFPNPTNSILNIEWKQLKDEQTQLELFNCVGKVIYSTRLNLKEGTRQIDVSHLLNGLYYLKIDNCQRKLLVY